MLDSDLAEALHKAEDAFYLNPLDRAAVTNLLRAVADLSHKMSDMALDSWTHVIAMKIHAARQGVK